MAACSTGKTPEISVSTSISNISASSASAALKLQVIDLDGANGTPGAVIGSGSAFDAGNAPIGQIQLAQPVLTLGWSAALLGEHVGPATLITALAVLACVAATQRAR